MFRCGKLCGSVYWRRSVSPGRVSLDSEVLVVFSPAFLPLGLGECLKKKKFHLPCSQLATVVVELKLSRSGRSEDCAEFDTRAEEEERRKKKIPSVCLLLAFR